VLNERLCHQPLIPAPARSYTLVPPLKDFVTLDKSLPMPNIEQLWLEDHALTAVQQSMPGISAPYKDNVPLTMTRLRRFAIGLIKSKSRDSVAATFRKLSRNVCHVFDYLRMTDNSTPRSQPSSSQAG
jgi:hypothetical protein